MPGELKAVGYIKGKKVATSKLETTGPATNLQITPLQLPITDDLALYEITVNDKSGLKVIDATTSIKVKGAGRLIGLDNGELDFAGPYKTDTRDAYLGRLLVTVQRASPTGEIQVTATSPGLTSATLNQK